MSIEEYKEKSKPQNGEGHGQDIPTEEEFDIVSVGETFDKKKVFGNFLILILVATASFGLGRLAFYDSIKMPVSIKNLPEINTPSIGGSAPIPVVQGVSVQSGSVVASKNSNKYHALWCPGAKQISETNKVYYASAEDARKAGLTPAGNCKGLE